MVDNYTLFSIKNTGERYNITSLISNLNWQDSIDALGAELTFTIARNKDDIEIKDFDVVEVGDKLILQNNGIETFRGIITDIDYNRYEKGITAFDYGFYLNKSKIIIQFRKMDGAGAIKQLGSKIGISIVTPSVSTQITKIYKDNTIAEIISDILEQATQEIGKKYFYEMVQNTLYIRELGFETIQATYQPTVNVEQFDSMSAIGDISKTESIQDMKNSVIITSNEEKDTRVIANVQDSRNIASYGLLQDIIQVDKKDIAKSNNIAKNKLKELNKATEDITISVLGTDVLKCGRLLDLNIENFGVVGKYLIKSTQHNYQNSTHKCSITVERWGV